MTALAIALGALAALVGIGLIWRWAAWPCPSWLVPLLENPYFEAVAGAGTLLDRAGVAPGMTVLDAGCGPGRVTLPAAARVGPAGRVVALDLQPAMLAKVRARLEAEDVRHVELVQAGLGDGRLEQGRFDVALLVTVLGEIPDREAALAELRRALRPGGVLSVTEVLPDPHYQPLARVRALAVRAGLAERSLVRRRLSYTLNLERPAEA